MENYQTSKCFDPKRNIQSVKPRRQFFQQTNLMMFQNVLSPVPQGPVSGGASSRARAVGRFERARAHRTTLAAPSVHEASNKIQIFCDLASASRFISTMYFVISKPRFQEGFWSRGAPREVQTADQFQGDRRGD